MASRTALLTIGDLRGGRNGVDSPLLLEPTQCVEAINVDWYTGLLARRRPGAVNVPHAGSGVTGWVTSLLRHFPGTSEDTSELFLFDNVAHAGRIVAGVASPVVWVDSPVTQLPVRGASFNRKLFLAYKSNTNRLHVWDGTSIRRTGLAAPTAAPTLAAAAGTGKTWTRWYKVRFGVFNAGLSEASPAASITITNQGGVVITRPALVDGRENIWQLFEAVAQEGPYYYKQQLPIATLSYTDIYPSVPYSPSAPLEPLVGDYTLPYSARYLLVDEARLLLAGSWDTPDYGSRVSWTPILFDVSGLSNDERIEMTTEVASYIDFDPGEGGDITGIGGPLFDCPYVFKMGRIYKMVRTGLAAAPYRPVTVSKMCGAIRHETIVLGEDENGQECLYFLSRRGPFRIGVNGLQYCGRDIEDAWANVNLADAARDAWGMHGVYHAGLHQVWWWTIQGDSTGNEMVKLVFDVKQGRLVETEGVRRGWALHTGRSSFAFCSVMYSDVFGTPNSLTLKPYVGKGGTGMQSQFWKCDVGSVQTDGGTPYTAFVRTRVELPGGSMATHGGVIEGHLVAFPTTAVITISTERDFALETRKATAIPLTVQPMARLIVPSRDLGAASCAALQIVLGDDGPLDQAWTLDQLVLRIRREEDR